MKVLRENEKPSRTFPQYIRDNKDITIPFAGAILLSIIAFNDNAPAIGYFLIGVSAFCVVASYVDWRRNG